MKHLVIIYNVKPFVGHKVINVICIPHTSSYMLHFRQMKMSMDSCYTLKVCLVIWMHYKSICGNLVNMFLLHHICIHFQKHLSICGLVEISILWHFHVIGILIQIYPWNLIVLGFFFAWLFYYKMSTLKSPKMMIKHCSREC